MEAALGGFLWSHDLGQSLRHSGLLLFCKEKGIWSDKMIPEATSPWWQVLEQNPWSGLPGTLFLVMGAHWRHRESQCVGVSDRESSPHMAMDGQLPWAMAALLTHIHWLLSLLCPTSPLPCQRFLGSPPVVGRILAPKRCPRDVRVPIPEPYVAEGTLHMWVQWRISSWRDEPGLSRWAQCGHSEVKKGGSQIQEVWWQKGDIGKCSSAAFEDGGRGHKQGNAGGFSKLEKARKWVPLESLRGTQPPPTRQF